MEVGIITLSVILTVRQEVVNISCFDLVVQYKFIAFFIL